jgi:hypothetical protein
MSCEYFLLQASECLIGWICSINDLWALANSCKLLSREYKTSQYARIILENNLTSLLSRFGSNILHVQHILGTVPGSMLSGSVVLQCYLGERWLDSDLDIYIPYDAKQMNKVTHSFTTENFLSTDSNRSVAKILTGSEYHKIIFCPRLVTYEEYNSEANSLQLIYIDMNTETWYSTAKKNNINFPYNRKEIQKLSKKLSHNGPYIIDFFDMSVLQNFFDGRKFLARNINDILQKTFCLNTVLSHAQMKCQKQSERKGKYELRGLQFKA